jgi:hypothetical protein
MNVTGKKTAQIVLGRVYVMYAQLFHLVSECLASDHPVLGRAHK